MKIGLKIIAILAVIALIAGGIYLLVENTSVLSSLPAEGGRERPEFGDGQMPDRPEPSEIQGRPEGGRDHNEISLTRGLAEVGKTLVKVSLISVLVLGIQFLFKRAKRLGKPKTLPA